MQGTDYLVSDADQAVVKRVRTTEFIAVVVVRLRDIRYVRVKYILCHKDLTAEYRVRI